jgi:small subunit ribosomal protein S8
MNVTDPIADMLTRIRNASLARHRELTLPSSRIKRDIARILVEEGFIESYATSQDGVQELLTIQLKYVEGKTPVVSGLKRISKPGLRVYARKTEIPRVLGGLGTAIPRDHDRAERPEAESRRRGPLLRLVRSERDVTHRSNADPAPVGRGGHPGGDKPERQGPARHAGAVDPPRDGDRARRRRAARGAPE